MTRDFIYAVIAAISVLATLQSAHTLYLTQISGTVRHPRRAPEHFWPPRLSFTVMLPARHEESVIGTTADLVSGGLTLSLGAGFPFPRTNPEFAAAGVPFAERIGCQLETVQRWRLLVSGTPPDMFRGRYRTFRGPAARPARPGGPPLSLAG